MNLLGWILLSVNIVGFISAARRFGRWMMHEDPGPLDIEGLSDVAFIALLSSFVGAVWPLTWTVFIVRELNVSTNPTSIARFLFGEPRGEKKKRLMAK